MSTLTDVERFLQAIFPDYAERGMLANLNPPAFTRDFTALDASRDCYMSVATFKPGALTSTRTGP